jgi:Flp pilus assembly protein TadD
MRLSLAVAAALLSSAAAPAAPRTLTFTTKSELAVAQLRELQGRIETYQAGPSAQDLARSIVALDPGFAMGQYYLSAVTPPPDGPKALEKAVALAKTASDGERRFIEAMAVARGPKPEEAIPALEALVQDYPKERPFVMVLGQTCAQAGRQDEARAAFEKALALDPATPRVYALLANHYVLRGDYAKARELYASARTRLATGVAPGAIAYGTAYSYLYEGKPDEAIKVLTSYTSEYRGADAAQPDVFIWNSIARINLENGRYAEAMKAYDKGFESVPGSGLSELDKKIWLGRLHHGRGRTLARMGHHEEAWKEAETIRKMIDEGGAEGKQFEPSYHYLAGYLKLEAGDYAAAVDHLKQADPVRDPFRDLLLARAYEKKGDKENARRTYQEVASFKQNTLERALSYPEAKRKLAGS